MIQLIGEIENEHVDSPLTGKRQGQAGLKPLERGEKFAPVTLTFTELSIRRASPPMCIMLDLNKAEEENLVGLFCQT